MYSDFSMLRRFIFVLLLLIARRTASASLGGDIKVNTNLTQDGSPYTINQDLVVAENATLTIQPGVELHFHAGVALQVKGLLEAKGNSQRKIVFRKIPSNKTVNVDDLNVTSPYNDGIRLRGGKNYRTGRLEIFLRGNWGTVCHDSFDIKDAQVSKWSEFIFSESPGYPSTLYVATSSGLAYSRRSDTGDGKKVLEGKTVRGGVGVRAIYHLPLSSLFFFLALWLFTALHYLHLVSADHVLSRLIF